MTALQGPTARASAGLVAGVIAGVLMALTAMIRVATLGLGFWLPMKLVAAIAFGVSALIGGAWVILVGVLIHLAVAGGGGMLFGAAVGDRVSAGLAFAGGLAYGVLIWAFNTWIILPWANPVILEREMVAPAWWFVYHLVYGATLVLVPLLVAELRPRRQQPAHAAA